MLMISSLFEKICHIPCWNVRQGHGSFLTFEFGRPYLEVREPKAGSKIKGLRYRKVTVCGEWHLWIYCCSWELFLDGELLAHSESTRGTIRKALKYIDGQKLVRAEVDVETADTVFRFDLGGVLKTRKYTDSVYEQWMLFDPQGSVLSVCSDGMMCYQPKDTPCEQEIWEKMK